jgi:penicillin-binding protein 1A
MSDKQIAPLALGQLTWGITVREITAGYAIFQNNGVWNKPRTFWKVTDSEDNIILLTESESEIVIQDTTASIMTKMLQNVMINGTGRAVTLRNTVDVAGKTGTTNADYDRWFVGYTPYYVGGVWFGYDMPLTLNDFKQNPAALVWDTVMTKLHQKYIDEAAAGGEPLKKFELAPGVVTATYCKDSGLLLSDACLADPRGSRAETGYFTRTTVPTTKCQTHVLVEYDTATGGVTGAVFGADDCTTCDGPYKGRGQIVPDRGHRHRRTVCLQACIARDHSVKLVRRAVLPEHAESRNLLRRVRGRRRKSVQQLLLRTLQLR